MRPARLLAAGAVLAGALSLTACDKPLPKITIQAGSTATTVSPSSYCWDLAHCRTNSSFDLPAIKVGVDGKVLVDVPHDLVVHGWVVQALTLDGKKSLAVSTAIHDSHIYRVASGVNGGQDFLVQVRQLHGTSVDASRWSFVVKVSATA